MSDHSLKNMSEEDENKNVSEEKAVQINDAKSQDLDDEKDSPSSKISIKDAGKFHIKYSMENLFFECQC